jgi:hypothetical protein
VELKPEGENLPAAFDRGILLHHSMNDNALASEILGLFRQQLETLAGKDWSTLDLRFEMHTLRGAAATIGAQELEALSREWREFGLALQPRFRSAMERFLAAAR